MANALALLPRSPSLAGILVGRLLASNTLFRQDADEYAAYLVDAETGEFQPGLSNGQREHDLDIAQFNVAAELKI